MVYRNETNICFQLFFVNFVFFNNNKYYNFGSEQDIILANNWYQLIRITIIFKSMSWIAKKLYIVFYMKEYFKNEN